MLNETTNKEELEKISPLFQDIRFYMGRTVLQGIMGTAYVNDINNSKFAILKVKRYCFISGEMEKETLKEIIDSNYKDSVIIPSDNLSKLIEEIYGRAITKGERYSVKKDVQFDVPKLEQMANSLPENIDIYKIDEKLADRIRQAFQTAMPQTKKEGSENKTYPSFVEEGSPDMLYEAQVLGIKMFLSKEKRLSY